MKSWVNEGFHTFSVTTLHPVGWGFQRIKKRVFKTEIHPPIDHPFRERTLPILLIHGIFHNATAFYRLERALRKRGFLLPHTLELWTSVNSLECMAEQVIAEARALRAKHLELGFSGKIRIIAHSLGGMVARTALLDPEFSQGVDKAIFLGTPHQGHPGYRTPFPRCLKPLTPQGPLMRRLREEPLPPHVECWNLRGGYLDIVTPPPLTYLPHAQNLSFPHVGHAGLLSHTQVIDTIASILARGSSS